MTSIVEASFAVNAGFLNPVQITMWPIRTRSVTIASALNVENDSNVISSVGSGTVVKWSKTHADSNPSSSACFARSTVRAQASAGPQPSYSPFQPWGISSPTCTACLLRRREIVRRVLVLVAHRDLVLSRDRVSAYPQPMPAPACDPAAPLAPAPTPWASTDQPSRRDGPPWHMTDMIAAEPYVARRILERLADPQGGAGRLAGAVGQAASSGSTVVITGCGTSEHAAQATVEILRDAIRAAGMGGAAGSVVSAQAFELALDPPGGGLVIGVSHEGGTAATNRALAAAAAAGARTALITASAHSPGAGLAEMVVETVELDQGWCHTVGYLSPIVAAAAV